MDKKILVTGGSGFIGSNFLTYAHLQKQDSVLAPSHSELNIENRDQLSRFFNTYTPEVVVNFAAHRDANSAELQRGDKEGSTWQTNVEAVRNLSAVTKEYNSFLIHISTDMVFSGSEDNPGPYAETAIAEDNFDKLSWYGWTKAEAERILTDNKKSAIIRIGNVTQPIYNQKVDYVGKILYLFDNNKLYPLFNDQYLTLTYIPSLFEVITAVIYANEPGIFHVGSSNIFTPFELGKYLIRITRQRDGEVRGESIKNYLKKWPNRYPQYGGLQVEKTSKKLSVPLLTWQEIIDIYQQKIDKL